MEVGNFDTYIPASTGFAGAWGAYPYLPSGVILISDMNNGLYVLEPNYVRACWLEGKVTNASTSDPIDDASIEILTTNVFETTEPSGNYKTGYAVSGTYDVLVKKAGYESKTVQAELENGEITILDVELVPLVPFAVSGLVIDSETNQPVPNAKVSIENDDFSYEIEADANGSFAINSFFEGDYDVFAGKWGYKTSLVEAETIDENNSALTIPIDIGYEDVFSLDLGWTVNFNAESGIWERGTPIGIFVAGPDIFITPPEDVTEDIGNHCYVTGNEADLFGGVLIGGDTDISSPYFDLTDYEEPFLSYSTWYLNVFQNGNPGNFDMYVKLSNGMETVYLDTLTYPAFTEPEWEYAEFNVLDHITPTDSMQITFEAASPVDFSEITEAGIDNFQVWDNAVSNTNNVIDNRIKLAAYPNPSDQAFVINYELENSNNNSNLLIYNTLGQLVQSYEVDSQFGKIRVGNNLKKGVYFAHITDGTTISKSLKLIKQ